MITSQVVVELVSPGGPPRSDGVHLSKVIRAMALESKILDEKWGNDLSLDEVSSHGDGWWASLDRDSQVRMAIGMAWEEWYAPNQLQDVAYHPGEMNLDGIFMTHDGESIDFVYGPKGSFELALHEIKTTSKSINTVGNLQSQWLWLAQCKGYAKALGTRIVYLHVLFLYGDYSRPFRQKLKCWRIEFTQAEIDENWELVTEYVRYRLSQDREDEGLEGGV